MKILIYSFTFLADCDFPLVHYLSKMGHEVYLMLDFSKAALKHSIIDVEKQLQVNDIITADKYKEFGIFANYLDLQKVLLVNRTHNNPVHPFNIYTSIKIYNKIKDINPDVIHLTWPLTNTQKLIYHFKDKIVMTIHDPFPHSGEGSKSVDKLRNRAIKNSQRFMLLNETQVKMFSDYYKVSKDRIFSTRLGIYECMSLFAQNNIVKKSNNVLFFGRISPYKGIEYLLQAMEKVREKIPSATLTIAGRGNVYFDFSKYENEERIDWQNRFITVHELATLIAQSTLVVCPYTDATQSGVVMTAFGMNKPVIATNVGGMCEYVKNEENGLLVEPRDPQSLATAILRLLSDEEERKRYESNIANINKGSNIGWEHIASDYEKFYSLK